MFLSICCWKFTTPYLLLWPTVFVLYLCSLCSCNIIIGNMDTSFNCMIWHNSVVMTPMPIRQTVELVLCSCRYWGCRHIFWTCGRYGNIWLSLSDLYFMFLSHLFTGLLGCFSFGCSWLVWIYNFNGLLVYVFSREKGEKNWKPFILHGTCLFTWLHCFVQILVYNMVITATSINNHLALKYIILF